jgi:hypothetical protein
MPNYLVAVKVIIAGVGGGEGQTNFRMGIRSLVEEVFLQQCCGQVPPQWDGCAHESRKVTFQVRLGTPLSSERLTT